MGKEEIKMTALRFFPIIVICLAAAEMAQLGAAFVQIERVHLQIGILNICSSVLHLVVLYFAWMTITGFVSEMQSESQNDEKGGDE
jgi:hypothetical protein